MSLENRLKKNYDLTPLTTFKIGGRAEFFVEVKNKRELKEAIDWAKSEKLPALIFAGGSNILITKKKITGLVIKISGQEFSVKGNSLTAWAGAGLAHLASLTYNRGLSGLEWAAGIPGSLGGAVRGNAGAYGDDISGQVAEVEAYDAARGQFRKFKKPACAFGYRDSIFKRQGNLIIVNVKLKLSPGLTTDIKKAAKINLVKRGQTNPKEPSAGCIFKNLEFKKIVDENLELALDLKAKDLFRGGKIGTAYLVDQLGLKGRTSGGAKISRQHANFIVNTDKAKAQDVLVLINMIKKKIKNRYKINLEEEVARFGE